ATQIIGCWADLNASQAAMSPQINGIWINLAGICTGLRGAVSFALQAVANPGVHRNRGWQAQRAGSKGDDLVDFLCRYTCGNSLANARVNGALAHGAEHDSELNQSDRLLIQRPLFACLRNGLPRLSQLRVPVDEFLVSCRWFRRLCHGFN